VLPPHPRPSSQVSELTTALEDSANALRVEVVRHEKELDEKLHDAVVNTRAQVEAELKAELDKRQWIIEGKVGFHVAHTHPCASLGAPAEAEGGERC
jgi:hypothetical protein